MYNFKCYDRNTKDFRFIITKDGHTMFPEDIIKELNSITNLKQQLKEKDEMIKLLKYTIKNQNKNKF